MGKKLILACMAVVALAAFALPATASASPTLCETVEANCVTVTGNPTIIGTNVGETLLKTDPASGEPTVLARCTTASMTGTLTKNNGTEIEGTITKASFTGTGAEVGGKKECTSSFGNLTVTTEGVANGTPWCLRANNAMNADEFQLRGGACSEAARKITYILDSTTAGECKYERGAAVSGTFTTHTSASEDAVLSVTSKAGTTGDTTFTKEAGGVLCPANGTLEMSFTLETDEAPFTPLFIH